MAGARSSRAWCSVSLRSWNPLALFLAIRMRQIALPFPLISVALDFEERIRQRNRRELARRRRIDDEHHRHLPRFAGFKRLPRETKAFELLEILRRVLRTVAWNRF